MQAVLLHDLIAHRAGDDARDALVDGERTLRYGDFARTVETYAAHLVALGVRRGDRVGILLPKSIEECAAIFAVSRAGGVFIPINPVLKVQQVAHILADSGAKALVTNAALLQRMTDAGSGLSVLRVDEPLDTLAAAPAPVGIAEDLAAILYTSGSTGQPKGVMLSHGNLIAGTRIVRTYLGISGADRILSILPFSFDYGLNQLLTAVEQRAVLVLATFQLGDQIVSALERHRITGLAGVPTIWAILTKAAPTLQKTALPHLRYITNSGGAVPEATVRKLGELLPQTEIFLMYGLTEAFRSTFLPPLKSQSGRHRSAKRSPSVRCFPSPMMAVAQSLASPASWCIAGPPCRSATGGVRRRRRA